MPVRKIRPEQTALGALQERSHDALLASVLNNISTAREQVTRSRHIVSQSQEIIDRTRLTLAHSSRIQYGMAGEASRNPIIPCNRSK
ncbi:MAG TPA: hypothetical protein VJW20_10450 [Candidatus Angelobacter sp.]|nr:hypothetical protein [Candidatus Angelobacter sp.]